MPRPSSCADAASTSPGRSGCRSCASARDVSASLFAYPDPKIGGGYFLLLAGLPPQAAKPDSAGLKREVTLVIDRSGSMRGEKLAQVREAALQVLAGLDRRRSVQRHPLQRGRRPVRRPAGAQVARRRSKTRPSSSKG